MILVPLCWFLFVWEVSTSSSCYRLDSVGKALYQSVGSLVVSVDRLTDGVLSWADLTPVSADGQAWYLDPWRQAWNLQLLEWARCLNLWLWDLGLCGWTWILGPWGWPCAEIALDMHAEAIEAGLKPGYAGASLEARSVGADLTLGWTEAWVHGSCLEPGAAGTDLKSSLPGVACSYHKLGAWVHRSCSGG